MRECQSTVRAKALLESLQKTKLSQFWPVSYVSPPYILKYPLPTACTLAHRVRCNHTLWAHAGDICTISCQREA